MNSETPLVVSPAREALTRAAIRADARAAKRVLEFFTAQINNNHTRKAYLNAPRCFAGCAQMGLLVVLGVVAESNDGLGPDSGAGTEARPYRGDQTVG